MRLQGGQPAKVEVQAHQLATRMPKPDLALASTA
jgi:hypothetical protein